MILGRNNGKVTDLELKTAQAFALYEDDIIALSGKEWKEEDYKEKSDKQWYVLNYQNAIYLCILIYWEVQRNKGIKDVSYYIKKYDLITKKECLACNNIDLDKVLNIFGLSVISDGIEFMEMNNTFIIENELNVPVVLPTININNVLAQADKCIINVNTKCILNPCN